MRKIAQLVSIIFHPLLFSTYLVVLLGYLFPPMLLLPVAKLPMFAAVIFGLTFLLPVLNLWIFKQFNIISTLTLQKRKERTIPFVFISIIYVLIAAMFVYRINLSINYTKLATITAALVVAASVITFFYKVSVHSLSVWGTIGIVLPLCKPAGQSLVYATVALILVAGFSMSARLYLNAHTPREILVGSLTGFLIGFGGIVYLF
jgi:hypothetical protein